MTLFHTESAVPSAPLRIGLCRGLLWMQNRFAEWTARRSNATALRRLKARDLRDIGLVRSDILAVHGLPGSANAADALRRKCLGRSGNW